MTGEERGLGLRGDVKRVRTSQGRGRAEGDRSRVAGPEKRES